MLIDNELLRLFGEGRPLSDLVHWADKRGLMLKIEAVRKPPAPKAEIAPALPSCIGPPKYTVRLLDYGKQKIQVIKVVREITGLGLKEAKKLVDTCPSTIREYSYDDDAGDTVAKLVDVGASAETLTE